MAIKSSLEHSVDLWETVAHVFTALVAIGLVIEYRDPFVRFWKTHDWRVISESIGGVLVTAGVAGEFITGLRSTSRDGELREANSLLASRAAETIAASNVRIAELNLKAEEEKTARAKIEAQMRHNNSRELFPDEVDILKAAAKVFAGQLFWIITQTSDYRQYSEQMVFSQQIESILTSQGWVKGGYMGPMYRPVSGSGIQVASGAGNQAQAAADAIREVLMGFYIRTSEPIVYDNIPLTLVLIDIGLN